MLPCFLIVHYSSIAHLITKCSGFYVLIPFFFNQELAAVGGKNANAKGGRKASKKERENVLNFSAARGRDKKVKPGSVMVSVQTNKNRPQRPQRVEQLAKEEGEMSDNEELCEQFKEVKWMEWCEEVMFYEIKTLKRLNKLQTTSADLPKEKVQHLLF